MRIAVVVLAGLGALSSGFLGARWVSDAGEYRDLLKQAEQLGVVPDAVKEARRIETAGFLLLGSAVAGVAGAALAAQRKGRLAAAVLIAAAVVPAVFAVKSLVFSFFLLAAGGLSLLTPPAGPTVEEQAQAFLRKRQMA